MADDDSHVWGPLQGGATIEQGHALSQASGFEGPTQTSGQQDGEDSKVAGTTETSKEASWEGPESAADKPVKPAQRRGLNPAVGPRQRTQASLAVLNTEASRERFLRARSSHRSSSTSNPRSPKTKGKKRTVDNPLKRAVSAANDYASTYVFRSSRKSTRTPNRGRKSMQSKWADHATMPLNKNTVDEAKGTPFFSK
eukprot:scaffold2088_cov399-Prasinococcus_capsulatus_cf.AAC.35